MKEYEEYFVKGYHNEEIWDELEVVRPITEFEKTLPLRKMCLEEYERRVKKFVNIAAQDCISVRQMIASFEDHPAFATLQCKGSLAHDLLFDEFFLFPAAEVASNVLNQVEKVLAITFQPNSKNKVSRLFETYEPELGCDDPVESPREGKIFLNRLLSVDRLMLLGIMYCPSTREQRAKRFYEIADVDLSRLVRMDDEELAEYVPLLYEIAYVNMVKLYEQHREPSMFNKEKKEIMPHIDVDEYLPWPEMFEKWSAQLTTHWLQTLFGKNSRIDDEKMVGRLEGQFYRLLQPHSLRHSAWYKYRIYKVKNLLRNEHDAELVSTYAKTITELG